MLIPSNSMGLKTKIDHRHTILNVSNSRRLKNDISWNVFVMTPTKWVGLTGAIGIISKAGGMKMAGLSATLYEQMREGAELDAVIRKNLEVLGYGE